MPIISVVVSETDHHHLEQEYAALLSAVPSPGQPPAPSTFAAWLGTRLMQVEHGTSDTVSASDIHVFNAVEKLITSLPQHGFQLAHTAPAETVPATSSYALAEAMVNAFRLQPQYLKRLQELFAHYLKSPKEIADTAQVGVTNRAYGALTEAHRRLTKRTADAVVRLGADKAIGRVEGATAILVSLDVMDTVTAQKRTREFKAQAQAVKKTGWVGKIFGESD